MKVLFVVNPVAGKGLAAKVVPQIKAAMDELKDVTYDMIFTEKPGHATDIARKAAKDGMDIVFAVGGDGTVNEVMNGLVNTGSALAVIPGGSGNDFIRSLGITGNTNSIIHETIQGEKKKIDIGYINGRYFINISSAGFDAEVVLATQKAKKFFLSGSTAYIAGLIKTIFTNKPRNVSITMGDTKIMEKVLLMAVANGKYYGGGMMAAPDAILDDGEFDICVIRKMPKIKLLMLFPQFMKGKHKKFKEVTFYRAEKISIECEKPMAVNVDGEVFTDTKASFELIKEGLYVMMPK